MKKKLQHKFVTRQDLQQGFHELSKGLNKKFDAIDVKFDAIDVKFDAIDVKFDAIDKKFAAFDIKLSLSMKYVNGRFEYYEDRLLKKMDKKFDEWYNRIDHLIGISETNSQEIKSLGRQHDRLDQRVVLVEKKLGFSAPTT